MKQFIKFQYNVLHFYLCKTGTPPPCSQSIVFLFCARLVSAKLNSCFVLWLNSTRITDKERKLFNIITNTHISIFEYTKTLETSHLSGMQVIGPPNNFRALFLASGHVVHWSHAFIQAFVLNFSLSSTFFYAKIFPEAEIMIGQLQTAPERPKP